MATPRRNDSRGRHGPVKWRENIATSECARCGYGYRVDELSYRNGLLLCTVPYPKQKSCFDEIGVTEALVEEPGPLEGNGSIFASLTADEIADPTIDEVEYYGQAGAAIELLVKTLGTETTPIVAANSVDTRSVDPPAGGLRDWLDVDWNSLGSPNGKYLVMDTDSASITLDYHAVSSDIRLHMNDMSGIRIDGRGATIINLKAASLGYPIYVPAGDSPDEDNATGPWAQSMAIVDCDTILVENFVFHEGYDGVEILDSDNIYIKNCTFWGQTDSNADVTNSNVTFENCIFFECRDKPIWHNKLTDHSMSTLAQAEEGLELNISYVNCLWISNVDRCPRMSADDADSLARIDMWGCVIYNCWRGSVIAASGGGEIWLNNIKCEYRDGPNSYGDGSSPPEALLTKGSIRVQTDASLTKGHIFVGDSKWRAYRNADMYQTLDAPTIAGTTFIISNDGDGTRKLTEPINPLLGKYPPVTISTGVDDDLLWDALKLIVGCRFGDTITARAIAEVDSWTGTMGTVGVGYLTN